jgi:hypothetical protein
MTIRDPWDSVPTERRLDFAIISEPLEKLAAAVIINVERALPLSIANVPGAREVLVLLIRTGHTMFSTIRYFCAEKPEDLARRPWFSSSAPPLLRSLLDEICTVLFIGEDIAHRTRWYWKSGWRELHEEYHRHVATYSIRAEWQDWLREYGEFFATTQAEWGITKQEAATPTLIPWWPTPSLMIAKKMFRPETQEFLEYMRDWFYREFSQDDHLSLPGLMRRGAPFLLSSDDARAEALWKKRRSDWVADALVLYFALLSELTLLCDFDFRAKCAYLWGILTRYSPKAAEVYELRYKRLLAG